MCTKENTTACDEKEDKRGEASRAGFDQKKFTIKGFIKGFVTFDPFFVKTCPDKTQSSFD